MIREGLIQETQLNDIDLDNFEISNKGLQPGACKRKVAATETQGHRNANGEVHDGKSLS
jgi:hypothetical protein